VVSDPATPATSMSRATDVAVLVALAVALVGLFVPPWPVGTDLPTHLAMAQLVADPSAGGALLERGWTPTTQGFVWLLVPLVSVLPPALALKVGLAVVLVALTLGARALGRAIADATPLGVVFVPALFGGFFVTMGFANFLVGVAIGLFALAAYARFARSGDRRALALGGALLVATAIGHVVVAAMIGLHALGLVAALADRDVRTRRVAALVTASLPAGLYAIAVLFAVTNAENAHRAAAGVGARPIPLVDQLVNAVTLLGRGVEVLLALGLAALALPRTGAPAPVRGAARVTLAWTLVYFAVPFHLQGWEYAQPRPLALLWIAGAAVLALPTTTRAGVLVALATTISAAVSVGHLTAALPTSRAFGEAVEAIDAVDGPAPGRTLTVRLGAGETDALPDVMPLLHVEALALARGGASDQWLRFQSLMHTVRVADDARPWPDAPPPYLYRALDCDTNPTCASERAALLDRVAVQGLAFDTVLVTPPDDAFVEALETRGYTATARARLEPTTRDLFVHLDLPAEADPWAVRVQVSYPGTIGVFAGVELPAADRDREAVVPIGPVPAGPADVQVLVLVPADGRLQPQWLDGWTVDVPIDEDLHLPPDPEAP